MVTNLFMEEQKNKLESTEDSLEEQEENIQQTVVAQNSSEKYSENIDEINSLDGESENQQGINELDHIEEPIVKSEEDQLEQDIEQSTETVVTKTEEKELEAPKKPQNPKAKWYILQAYAGYEGRVEKTINEKLKIEGIEHLVEEIFIPSEDIVKTKDGQKRKINQKYFPGYVLVRMELTPDLWHLLMEINRVSGFIGGTQKNPLPLDDIELEKIREQIIEGSQQKATEEEFSIGEKVTITEGSFGNFSGTIDEINQERRKLKVLVSIFGRPTPVEVEFDKVKHVVE